MSTAKRNWRSSSAGLILSVVARQLTSAEDSKWHWKNVPSKRVVRNETSMTSLLRQRYAQKNRALLGGGAGVALSAAALDSMRKAKCFEKTFPIISKSVPGGDGWLGQCLEWAGVPLLHDWRFKSLPPFAFSPTVATHAVTFHKAKLQEAHVAVQTMLALTNGRKVSEQFVRGLKAGEENNRQQVQIRLPVPSRDLGSGMSIEIWMPSGRYPLCQPVLLRDLQRVVCSPFFIIIGAQKSGTTSMFSYLGQHPQVKLPSEKEMNFFGTPWPPNRNHPRLESLSHYTYNYLSSFPLLTASYDQNYSLPSLYVYGEASPDYLVSRPCVLHNMMRFAPNMRVIVSLRDPIARAVSAYENKRADGTVHKHLVRDMYKTWTVDKRKDDLFLIHKGMKHKVPSLESLIVRDLNRTISESPDQALHFTMTEKPLKDARHRRCGNMLC